MPLVNGMREVSRIIAGTDDATALQTYLGTAANAGSFSQALSMQSQAQAIFNSPSASLACSGSALASAQVLSNATALAVLTPNRTPARLGWFNTLITNLKLKVVNRFLNNAVMTGTRQFMAPLANGGWVGRAGTATMTSTFDGFTWTYSPHPFGSNSNLTGTNLSYANGITWGSFGDAASANMAILATSDGSGWTTSKGGYTYGNTSQPPSKVVYGSSSGVNTYAFVHPSSQAAFLCPSGTHAWTGYSLPFSSGWVDIAYIPGVFFAVTDTSGPSCATSVDGQTWTQRTCTGASHSYPQVIGATFGGTPTLVMTAGVGNATGSFHTSTNGLTWTARSIAGASTATLGILSYFNGACYLGVSSTNGGPNGVLMTTDGITWTQPLGPLPSGSAALGVMVHPVSGEMLIMPNAAYSSTSVYNVV